MLANQFGHFTDDGRTFVITDPATPMPWVNVICNGRFGVVVSQNGGGFSWLDNSQLNVLTRWEMDLARDVHGKYLYLADQQTGDVWSLAPSPCKTAYSRYRCEHTQGATTFETEHLGIGAVWTIAVAPNDPVEVWTVTLTNHSKHARRLRLSSFFEWCCGVAPDTKREFHRLFITTRHDAARRAVLATKNMWDTPAKNEKEHWNKPWPYVAGHAVAGPFEEDLAVADKASFLGRYGTVADPAGMHDPLGGPKGFGRFGDGAAALGGDLTIEPGETVKVAYVLTIGSSDEEVTRLIDTYLAPGRAEKSVREAGEAWRQRLGASKVKTGLEDFDLLANTWLPYQAISGRLWARTGFYQQSGAFGFRDQLQDSQVWLPLEPARCREQILLHAAHQFADGSVYHWWHPLAEFGLRTLCSDDYLWLPFLTANYIKDTGDTSILSAHAPFVDDPAGSTLLDHCRRSLKRTFERVSPRGLPLIGSCDWNDGLSAMGVDGKGESVWLAFFLCGLLSDFAVVLEKAGDAAGASELRAKRGVYEKAIEAHAWDGEWYLCASRDDGRWIGSKDNEEGRVTLNPQTWAVLTETGSEPRRDAAWDSVRRHLLKDMGPVLLAPAYSVPDATIGYITRYAPGLRENGGVYMHAATWALMAACKRKDAEAVERIWSSISPPTRCRDAEAYRAEPYVTPGNVDGPESAYPGRAGWTWYTGSAAWLYRVSLEWVVGVRPVWEGLLIDPCPVKGMGQVDVTRVWRGRKVRVRYDAGAFASEGVRAKVTVNGVEVAGNVIRDEAVGAGDLDVRVEWMPGARVRTPGGAEAISGRHV
jgi:cellobiose phosphorylase